MIGLKFTMNDGTVDHYDPVDMDNLFRETETDYQFYVAGYDYTVMKADVKLMEQYEICPVCGYELTEGECSEQSDKHKYDKV